MDIFVSLYSYASTKRYCCKYLDVVIVIAYYSTCCLDQETAKRLFGLRVTLPHVHFSATNGGNFTLTLFNSES